MYLICLGVMQIKTDQTAAAYIFAVPVCKEFGIASTASKNLISREACASGKADLGLRSCD